MFFTEKSFKLKSVKKNLSIQYNFYRKVLKAEIGRNRLGLLWTNCRKALAKLTVNKLWAEVGKNVFSFC